MQRFSEKLVLHHKPIAINYRAKFGLCENKVEDDGASYEADTPECPVCGNAMVLREAKKGKNEGNKFWGCSQFPKCRGAITLETDQKEEIEEVSKCTENEPVCPKCNGPMVKRVSKTGKNIGQAFWGCSEFPNCRGVVSVN